MVVPAKRDILSFLADPPNQKLKPARAAVLKMVRAKRDIPSFLRTRRTRIRGCSSRVSRVELITFRVCFCGSQIIANGGDRVLLW